MSKKVFVLVLDGFGVGAMTDAKKFGPDDDVSNSFLNVERIKPYNIPMLKKMGLKNINEESKDREQNPIACFGKLQEESIGKDTTTGHFEMMGIITKTPNPTFPNGFDEYVVSQCEKIFGTKILGNCVASGTEIIKKLGDEHLKTGYPIIYTSADSVLQVACHIDVIPLEKQYEYCEEIRKVMVDKYAVGRIIARPFTTENGEYVRINTARKDYSILPPKPNTLNTLKKHNILTVGVGKIKDIFASQDIDVSFTNHTNVESLEITEYLASKEFEMNGFIFVNLVDTDMVYGHRNDVDGYRQAIEKVDISLSKIVDSMSDEDVVIITGDNGCYPTTASTDHSREYTPFIIYSKNMKKPRKLGTLKGFENVGKAVEKLLIEDKNIDAVVDELCKN